MVERLIQVRLAASTPWHWVQAVGRRAQADLEAELALVQSGGEVDREPIEASLERLLLLIGADGVMVPFRPQAGSPKGATVWREVKVAVLARLGARRNRFGRTVTTLRQRRLVAVLGDIDQLAVGLRQAALAIHRQPENRHIMLRVSAFLDRHRTHLGYPALKADDLPLGSGFVESAVKWLIQQRFKGVGMRWSQDGFNHLLLLRLAWANGHFDALFAPSPIL
jgi:hypothetical protein